MISDAAKFARLQDVLPGVSRETHQRLLAYEALFFKWSKAFNLAAPSTLNDFWTRHILDSVQVASIRKPSGHWVDIGSGGGLPGIPLAILMAEQTGGLVHLIESNGKKAAFLRNAIIETGAAGTVHACRIEAAASLPIDAEVVTARALAPLADLITLSKQWLDADAIGVFHKGREYREEVRSARDVHRFDLIEHPSVVDPASAILEIRTKPARTGVAIDAEKDI